MPMKTVEPVATWDVRPWGCPMVMNGATLTPSIGDIDGDDIDELLVTDRETVWIFRKS